MFKCFHPGRRRRRIGWCFLAGLLVVGFEAARVDGRPSSTELVGRVEASQAGSVGAATVQYVLFAAFVGCVFYMYRLNRRLTLARQAADAANVAKSAFLANMSHEIRTPMTAILGFTDQILDPDTNAKQVQAAAQTIRRNGNHLIALVNDILDLSKIESGKLRLESAAVAIRPLCRDLFDLLGARATENGDELTLRFKPPIPETIIGDSVRLKQALINLVGNMINVTRNGKIQVVVSCDAQAGLMRFDATDDGIGLGPELQASVMDAFSQSDPALAAKTGGAGLGLTITKQLASLMGGALELTSGPDEAATLTLTVATGSLDGVQWVSAADDAPTEYASVPTTERLPKVDGRVLLVEDGVDNQRLLQLILRKAGASVTIAVNGADAIEQIDIAENAGAPFDLVLMDMQMPVLDGYEATRRLRERGYDRQIVALTAHAMRGQIDKCLEAGCDHFLSKPVDRATLIREVAARIAKPSKFGAGETVAG